MINFYPLIIIMSRDRARTEVVVPDGSESSTSYVFNNSLPGYNPPYSAIGNNPNCLYCGPPQCQLPAPLPAPVYDDPAYVQSIIMNRPLSYVTQIFPNVRILIQDGIALDRVNNINPQRINVAIRNNYVSGFLGIY